MLIVFVMCLCFCISIKLYSPRAKMLKKMGWLWKKHWIDSFEVKMIQIFFLERVPKIFSWLEKEILEKNSQQWVWNTFNKNIFVMWQQKFCPFSFIVRWEVKTAKRKHQKIIYYIFLNYILSLHLFTKPRGVYTAENSEISHGMQNFLSILQKYNSFREGICILSIPQGIPFRYMENKWFFPNIPQTLMEFYTTN